MDDYLQYATIMEILLILCTVGSGLFAGIFYIFSICIMKALNKQPTKQAISTMQSINKIILRPTFFIVFMGTPFFCAVVFLFGLISNEPANYIYAYAAASIYIISSFGVTIVKNVPMNNSLRDKNINSEEDIKYWQIYFKDWTYWNHIRLWGSLVPCILFSFNIASLNI